MSENPQPPKENPHAKELTPIQQKYIATYVQRVYLELEKIETEKQIDDMPKHLGLYWMNNDTPLGLLKRAMYHAMERRDLICDYADAGVPQETIGKCDYENHYENVEDNVELTEEEQEKFDDISDKEGWYEACKAFDEKFNPSNQKLTLLLGYDEDSHKLIPSEVEYACETCMEEIQENADGYVTCDMEDYEG